MKRNESNRSGNVNGNNEGQPESFDEHLLETDQAGGAKVDRRSGVDRRDLAGNAAGGPLGGEGDDSGLNRRRGVGRRRSDWARAAEEGEMNREQFLFVKAIESFKRSNGVMYPTWTDVLEVIRLLGYRKTMKTDLKLTGAEDFTEAPNALSGVRSRPGHPEQRRRVA